MSDVLIDVSQRVFNFSAGPAVLPLDALQEAQHDLLCLPGAGASVLEISHRGKAFGEILQATIDRLTRLLKLPDDYQILFLQGGARLQFSMIPMNLLGGTQGAAEYILTGSWGEKAFAEAQKVGPAVVRWSGREENYVRVPRPDELTIDPGAPFAYITSNETIQGVQFATDLDMADVPLVCDASSDFLHRPLDIANYSMVYACAQKNAGPAGVTIVVMRKQLLERSPENLPGYLNYRLHAENNSLYNTPPTFAIYMVGLVAKWLEEKIGGLDAMYAINRRKAERLYDVIDQSEGFYQGHADRDSRSLMNVTFRLPNGELEDAFVNQAADRRLCNLKGHRSVGGIRASIYNAMPLEGVEALSAFMTEFCQKHRGTK